VSIVGGITNWTKISAGSNHNLALRADGTIWAWGYGGQGRLGTNDAIARSSPVSIVGGITNWTKISAGSNHSLALRADGTIWAWGSEGNSGRLGLGSPQALNVLSPLSIVGGITDWIEVSAGLLNNLAIRSNGTLWTWGDGAQGQLGTNSTTATGSPVSVVGGFTDWVQASPSRYFSMALRSNGTAWAWGYAGQGSLGTNNTINTSSPVSVVGGITDWLHISSFPTARHATAIRSEY
jgi:alpha-tubulin suppressor-like RCC1 family protein